MDKEQRAHDITLMYIQNSLDNPENIPDSFYHEDGSVTFDIYQIYKGVYSEILKLVNEDFN